MYGGWGLAVVVVGKGDWTGLSGRVRTWQMAVRVVLIRTTCRR